MSERASGYLIKARIWVPADPQDPESMATAARWVQNMPPVIALNLVAGGAGYIGIAQLEVDGPPKFHARRAVPPEIPEPLESPEEMAERMMEEAAAQKYENDPPIPPDPAEKATRRVPRPLPMGDPDPDFDEVSDGA